MRNFLIIALFIACISACRTVPVAPVTTEADLLSVDIAESQTEIVGTATELSGTIDALKTITDGARTSGVIRESDTKTVIEYVDKSDILVSDLTDKLDDQTERYADLSRLRVKDNAEFMNVISARDSEIKKEKWKSSIYFKWASGATLVLSAVGFWFIIKIKTPVR